MTAEALAQAKVNLTLHVTGQREDGYHLLDSLVMFANVGDTVRVSLADKTSLQVTGPMAKGVPTDESNLVWKAAQMMDTDAKIALKKILPHAAGLGGGSADAAATLRLISRLTGKPIPDDLTEIGADVPVCLGNRAARMRNIGDEITPMRELPALYAVLVNPGLAVPTKEVFARLKSRENPPMPEAIPEKMSGAELAEWIRGMRNDLEEAAIELQPRIAQVLNAIEVTGGCRLARMSGSGGTCFGLYRNAETAGSAAGRLREGFPAWWVKKAKLNAPV
ncbi:4-(cytidine 5'-diphospho)-2-C-methyl-D-erythritol kinase [Roseovarius aestuariivivens]|uniref:4-(cytidine 5'-diphospho)-2-C-methyl-D-erythritol kinase n=1 Tax=Roseovarius aestuariivivens TaxID=1888910 RepID=UPI0010816E4F|nr:4-(cytidine 5'-diphospho)-2-C-methyl-D-erythritol kinase [Roseovarius aestuariivivens]